MALLLPAEEPEAGPWRVALLSTVVSAVTRRGPGSDRFGRPAVLAVDGRSNNGKTTLAARIRAIVPGSAVVHTDDIAWEHSCFGWTDLLVDGILVPARQGRPVSYRPPPWDEHGRAGSIEVPEGCPLLIVEGDGAGRREVTDLIDTLIWVQADQREAARRAAVRDLDMDQIDLANMPAGGSPPDHDGWTAEELPFNRAQRTWERADLIVCGTPEIDYDPATQIVVAPPWLPADRLPVRLPDDRDQLQAGLGQPRFSPSTRAPQRAWRARARSAERTQVSGSPHRSRNLMPRSPRPFRRPWSRKRVL